MAAALLEVRDAVVALINSAGLTFGGPLASVTATAAYNTELEASDCATMQVTVVPESWSLELLSRGVHLNHFVIDVGVRKRVAPDSVSECDAVTNFVRDVVDVLRSREVTPVHYEPSKAVEVAVDPVFSVKHLREQGVFLSVIRATYPLLRAMTA